MYSYRKKEYFTEIYLKYLDNLYNTALWMTRHPGNAEDLVEDTFHCAFRFFHKFKRGTNIKAWLFKIMHNLFINNYKKEKHPDIVELKENLLFENNVSQDVFSQFFDKEIKDALNSIPCDFREAVVLSDVEGFSYKEISKILSCPKGTVRSRIYRGRKLLFNKLYDYAKSYGYLK